MNHAAIEEELAKLPTQSSEESSDVSEVSTNSDSSTKKSKNRIQIGDTQTDGLEKKVLELEKENEELERTNRDLEINNRAKDHIIERDAKRYDELLHAERSRFDVILQKAFALAEKLQLSGRGYSAEEGDQS